MQAMILAAGLGTRLRPYSNIRPKPLFPVLNQPLLRILINMLEEAGCTKIIVNGHHLRDQLKSAVAESNTILYQDEPRILGTGGSLREALPQLEDEPLLVVNGDIFHNIDLAGLYEEHRRSTKKVTMAMHDIARFNTVDVQEGCVRTFKPQPKNKGVLLAFTGVHVVDPSIIEMIPSGQFFHIIDLYEKLVARGESLEAVRVDGVFWQDIGTPEDYLGLHARLLSNEINQPLPIRVPDQPWLVSAGGEVDPSVQLEGWGCIGNARIGPGVRLCNCVVWDGAVVAEGAQLKNTIVTPGSE